MKFGTRVRLKRWNDRGEFELDQTRSKNKIAENLVALGHETHNRNILFLSLTYAEKALTDALKDSNKVAVSSYR